MHDAAAPRVKPPARQPADLTEAALDLDPWSTHDAPLPSRSVTGSRTVGWTAGDADDVPPAPDVVGIRGDGRPPEAIRVHN